MRRIAAAIALFFTSGLAAGACGGTNDDGLTGDGDGGAACANDGDCPESSPVCDELAEVCVDCLFDADCSGNAECENRQCVEVTSCNNSLDCTDAVAGRICDRARGVCVECVRAEDCGDAQQCVDSKCEDACENSLDCPTGQVCNPETDRCVECVGPADCEDGEACINDTCRVQTDCDSDNDCTPLGQLCDVGAGVCVDCLGNTDCPDDFICASGECQLSECAPGSAVCSNGAVVRCRDDGSGFAAPEPCSGSTCVESGRSAACEPWVCTPDATECDGDVLVECASDGLSTVSSTDCSDNGQRCSAGQCRDGLCDPGEDYCDGDEVKRCNSSGNSATTLDTCTSGEFCDAGTASCVSRVCTPNQDECDGDTVRTCNSEGSGYLPGGTDCGAMGQTCAGGACNACPSGRGPVEMVKLVEVFFGTNDYAVVQNNSNTCPVNIGGFVFAAHTASGSSNINFTIPSGFTLQPAQFVYVVEPDAFQMGDLNVGANIPWGNNGNAMLCSGTCNGSNVLDAISFNGGSSPPSLPSGVSFTPGPLEDINENDDGSAYRRAEFNGAHPTFRAADWEKGNATRGICPLTEPMGGDSCLLTPGSVCNYGMTTCTCLLTWLCT